MINNVLDYICTSLNFRLSVRLYKQSLNCPNITYSVAKIKKLEYKELDIFIPSIGNLSTILKIIIFVDSINEGTALTKYLCTKFSDNLKDKSEQMI